MAFTVGMDEEFDLPPPFDVIRLREREDAFAVACRRADACGAGSLFTVGRFDLLEFAVVLEPDVPLRTARRAFFVCMNALADAIGAHAPPQKPVSFAWPDVVRFDGARLGGARLGWPDPCADDAVPAWLVFAPMLIASKMQDGEAGFTPYTTALDEEDLSGGAPFLASFARHLMFGLDLWAARGFAPIAEAYLDRLKRDRAGDGLRLDENGDLLIDNPVRKGPAERHALLAGLAEAAWFDPAKGRPQR